MAVAWFVILLAAKFVFHHEFDPLFWWLLVPMLFQNMYDNRKIGALQQDVARLQRVIQAQAAGIIYPR